MADLIQIRRDIAENWASVNPILKLGEIGFVTVSGSMTNPIQFKVGDGTLQWNNLPLQYGSSFESITLGETTYYPEDGSRSIVLPEIGGSSSVIPGSGENSAQQSGSGAEASGEGAFAEGDGVASGDYSHAEGFGTESYEDYSHAEGYLTKAEGVASHAEGVETTASGNYSHAEGASTTASGDNAHSEGQNTTASGVSAHAEGYGESRKLSGLSCSGNVCTTTSSHNLKPGNVVKINDIFAKVVSVPGATTFTIDIRSIPSSDSYTGYKLYGVTYDSYSHAEGEKTTASGASSHAEGASTTASGTGSHAEGENTLASGRGSHAEGVEYNEIGTSAMADAAHAEGAGVVVKGQAAHGEGVLNVAGRTQEEAVAALADFPNLGGTTEQKVSKLIGFGSHVEGATNKALGSSSHAEGYSTQALVNSTHAEGNTTTASGEAAHSEGYKTTASGNQAHAEGYNTEATANQSHAEGESTTASGINSHAEGYRTYAYGATSHTEGYYTVANNNVEHAEGQFNVTLSNSIHTVGVGTSLTSRKNGHVITTDGKHYIPGVGSYVGTEETLPADQDLATVLSNKLGKGTPTLGYNYLSCSLVSGHNYLVSRYSEDHPDLIFILKSDYSDVYAYSFTDPATTLGINEESGVFKLYINCAVDASQQSYVSVIDLSTEEFIPLVNVVQLPQTTRTIVPKVIQDMHISGTIINYGEFVPQLGSISFAAAAAAFKAGRDIKLVYSVGTASRYYSIVGYYDDPDGEGDFLYAFSPTLNSGGNLQIIRWYNPN